ncbi:37S ribosomal protein, mitochondrial [Lachnellula hyalina]|uniref:Small ribosomal subunit protein uS5m n=1 Tax=Lachnellula hyalina TaxID=1316788 RepID=A0A8H8QU69_9HELO|nr:37S ribosomal protein, mitochondrial [Lachnellula hyalina]TVY22853.1 37S ribosomal protein, mitochondrial [Lachnellula hyalina]
MSVSRPARCLFPAPSIPTIRPRIRCRNLHSSPNLCERRKPRYASIKASDMGLVSKPAARDLFKRYDTEEKAALAKRYTPAQMEAIEAAEEAIDPDDLSERGVIRTDWGSLSYLDDFSQMQPTIDKKIKREGPIDPKERLMTPEEYAQHHKDYFMKIMDENEVPIDFDRQDPEQAKKLRPNRLDLFKSWDEVPDMIGSNGPLKSESMLAPGIPRNFESAVDPEAETKGEDEDPRDPDGRYDLLRKQTGLSLDQILKYNVKILVKHRVVNQTRLGKIQSMYILAIAGNGDGRLGLGQAKGQELEDAMMNARIQAIRNMQPIPRYEERTIYGEVEGKVSAAEVKLMSRPPGFGLRCQHLIFEMARAAGIQDLAARVPRSRNKMNTVKATYEALMKQRIPDEVARGRGKKLVDVRKVYYAGRV